MIQANELRIGNWVNFISVTVQFQGTACYGSGQFNMEDKKLMPLFKYSQWDYYQSDWDSLHPIPLTPEVLIAAGFEEDKVDGQGWQMQIMNDGNERWLIWNELGVHISNVDYAIMTLPIQSLHQLQNLFFALTGQELSYTP